MSGSRDDVLVEAVRVHRARLTGALLFGQRTHRRRANNNVGRFLGSLVLSGVLTAGCAGYSFVQANLPAPPQGGNPQPTPTGEATR